MDSSMPKLKLHKVIAVGVLGATILYVATGEFSSVGSAEPEPVQRASQEQTEAAPEKTVQVAVPPQLEHARTIRVSGQTEPDKKVVLASRAAGVIAELAVEKGQHVEKGDLILRLDTEGKEAAFASAEQTLAQRRAEAEAAERLAKSGNLASLQLEATRAALAAAESQLQLAKAELDRVKILAPFSGIVDRTHVEEGSAIMQGAEVATLLKLDPIVISGEISERELGNLQTGDLASVTLVNGRTVQGKLRYVSRSASPQTRTFRIEVEVPNPDNAIPAGMTAEIAVQAKALAAVALPRSVITLHPNGDLGVRSVEADGTVVFHPIEIIDDTPEALYVAGVPADARIIVAGQDFVVDGEKVVARDADESMIKNLARINGHRALQ